MSTTAEAGPVPRHTIPLLAVCQALFGSIQTMAIATTPLAAYAMLDDKSLATVPIFLVQLGIMATTLPASFLMARIGRRGGFTVGALAGIVSGLVSAAAIYQQSFTLLCVGAFLQGSATAFAFYFRFAAADAAEPAKRATAISLVLAGGVLAGFIGPEVAKRTVDWFSPVLFAGVYVSVAVISAMVLVLLQGLRIPGLTAAEKAEGGRPIGEIMRQPKFMVALVSSMLGYAVMTLVMSATPLAMQACGFKFGDSATVIQAHVIAMFLPSFFTGHLIKRFGAPAIISIGAVIEFACALVNLSGVGFEHFLIANILVGLGWNFTYVGGSALLTETYRPAERAKAQGTHDFLVYTATATAAAVSGLLHANSGWTAVNYAAMPAMLIVLAAVLAFVLISRRSSRQAAE